MRKTNVVRSPGGTPLRPVKRSRFDDETDEFAQALKQKFALIQRLIKENDDDDDDYSDEDEDTKTSSTIPSGKSDESRTDIDINNDKDDDEDDEENGEDDDEDEEEDVEDEESAESSSGMLDTEDAQEEAGPPAKISRLAEPSLESQ